MNLEALLKPIETKPATPCKSRKLIDSLEEPYRTALDDLINKDAENGGLSPNKAAARIAEAGIDLSSHSIYRHRLGACACRSMNDA